VHGFAVHAAPILRVGPEKARIAVPSQLLVQPAVEVGKYAARCAFASGQSGCRVVISQGGPVEDIQVGAPVMSRGAWQGGPAQNGLHAGPGLQFPDRDWPLRIVKYRAPATRLFVPDQTLALETAKAAGNGQVKAGCARAPLQLGE